MFSDDTSDLVDRGITPIWVARQSAIADGSFRPSPIICTWPATYTINVETLELCSGTLNCLKRAGINKVGEALEKKKAELLRIRYFGEKSYNELYDSLTERNLLLPEMHAAV